MKLFEDILEASAKFVAGEAMDKGKKKVNELELKNEMSKAYKQLGELYYVMRKTGEMNEELLTQYYNNIADIELKLAALEADFVNEDGDYTVTDETETIVDTETEELIEEESPL